MLDAFRVIGGAEFFGGLPENCASVPIGGSVSRVRLSLPAHANRILNLKSVVFRGVGGERIIPSSDWDIRQSSIYSGDMQPSDLLHDRGCHTRNEISPFWEIEFGNPIYISQVEICSRSDRWGARVAGLSLALAFPDTDWVSWWQNNRAQAAANFHAVAREMGFNPHGDRDQVRAAILACLPAVMAPVFRARCWAAILATLSFQADTDMSWRSKVADDYEAEVIAAYLLWRVVVVEGAPLQSLQQFQSFFPTKTSIRDLEKRLRSLADAFGVAGHLQVTRHGVQRSPLMGPKENYTRSLREVFDYLSGHGFLPMICYGTLLGARRTGSFILGDDDIDVLAVPDDVFSRAQAQARLLDLASKLRASGWSVGDDVGHDLNLHACPPGGVWVDIFLCWREDENLCLHMEKMKIRSIPFKIIAPPKTIPFLGVDMPCPGNVEDFLIERYGMGWEEPDHFFEWPWPLLP